VEVEWQAGKLPVCIRTAGSETRPLRHKDGWSNGLLTSAPMNGGKTDKWTEVKWDHMGRPCGVTDSSGLALSTRYNAQGRVSTFSRKVNGGKPLVTRCAYDDHHRLVHANAPWGHEQREYYADGVLKHVTVHRNGARSDSLFDRYGRIISHLAFDGGVTRWHYRGTDDGSSVSKIDLPNGETIEYVRSASGDGVVTLLSRAAVKTAHDSEGQISRLAWGTR